MHIPRYLNISCNNFGDPPIFLLWPVHRLFIYGGIYIVQGSFIILYHSVVKQNASDCLLLLLTKQ